MKACYLLLLAFFATVVGAEEFDYRLAPRLVAPGIYVFVGRKGKELKKRKN